ncbi:MAG: hypothetical protein ACHP6H_05845, partial [Legionellales bacterium]
DEDRVFAYGLEPLMNEKAIAHLVFMGTTYPAGQGFVPQINTDLKGFETAGHSLYKSGRGRIREWLLKQSQKVHVCGLSLGGSLSLLLAIDQGDLIGRVDATNPPGLHDSWYKNPYDKWAELQEKPQVVIQTQANDPVSQFGIWKKEWDILWVMPPEDKKGSNAFFDHFLNYAGFAETEFTSISAEQENAHRPLRNFLFYTLGRVLIYYPLLFPYNFVIRPSLHFIRDNLRLLLPGFLMLIALLLAITLGAMVLISGFNGAGLIGLSALIFVSLGVGQFFVPNNKPVQSQTEELLQKMDLAHMHDPKLRRNPTMDLYNVENVIEIKRSRSDLHTYNKIMGSLGKHHEILPISQNLAEESLFLTTTKAKAVHIKNTLFVAKRTGIEHEHTRKAALEDHYAQYHLGHI